MLVVWGDDIRSTRMRIGCQYGDTTAGNILKGMGSYSVKGGAGDGGRLGPEQECVCVCVCGGGGGGGGTGLVPEGGRAGVGGLVTVVSEGGCAGAVSGDLRSGAPHNLSNMK